MTTPSCPVCGAKFSHDLALLKCRKCAVPDELLRPGRERALAVWRRENGFTPGTSTASRRRRAHGRVRGRGRVSGGTRRVKYRRKSVSNGHE